MIGTSQVTLGNSVNITAGTISSNDDILIAAWTSANVQDQIDLVAEGVLPFGDAHANLELKPTNLVTIGNNGRLLSTGNIDIGAYTQASANASAEVSTGGLVSGGSAETDVTLTSTQNVTIGAGNTIQAFYNVNVAAGSVGAERPR